MRNTHLKGLRLSLTPWANEALSVEAQERLTRKAAEMGVRVSVGRSTEGWTIRVASDMTRQRYGATEAIAQHSFHHLKGDLEQHVGACLDVYQERETWTTDEILTVAAQSGIEVSRA